VVEKAMGGVLFIDEAYAFDPENNKSGREIFEELLVIAEEKRENLSIFLAGYQKDMEQKLFAFNEGLKSRFSTIVLEDFSREELEAIWSKELNNREGWDVEKELVNHVASYRLAKGRGSRGFGNARDVRNLFEKTVRSALARVLDENPNKVP
jgi:replication-associated recombination protein RarA